MCQILKQQPYHLNLRLRLIGVFLCLLFLPAQGRARVRQEWTGPSVTSATQVSSTSATPAAGPASATTTPTTATHSLVSLQSMGEKRLLVLHVACVS